ncbi:cysteine synthase family protein [bacterium]|nr:cysteine synthase family protein [bacterium]
MSFFADSHGGLLKRVEIANCIEELVGNTPLLKVRRSHLNLPTGRWLSEIQKVEPPKELKSDILLKLEYLNPGGSVKDRIARKIIDSAEDRGEIKPGATIVEATSGNTGAGLAMIAASRGYNAILCMPDKMSSEKINALRAYGAKVMICPTNVEAEDPRSYYSVARRLAKESPNGFLANQYFNNDNPQSHYETTGPEIWEQTQGRIKVFACGIGTGGTISGTAKYLKEKNPEIKIIAIDPKGSVYAEWMKSGNIDGYHSYLVEGIGEDMIPGTVTRDLIDELVTVWDDESFNATRVLSEREGVLVGGSCGSAFFGTLQYLQMREAQGSGPLTTVCLLPDSGTRYLSKVFNETWFEENSVPSTWGDFNPKGGIEYVDGSKPVPGL